ncbi:putative Type I site-specific deoxyribonuclease [Vibrio chagasii]|nr:putative Type I site-specific deoxyribonuclease [Vibrio chagasii]CAH7045995.1 putative Type I site-specific deoxyribonuclease [Vibrio chagasii]CAH7056835.1 putative Type I site-specific deoxyribonuclease [Vibrio chagasii]CAH7111497.1 putative Type I site-specific deoxyribonuclease [Vibrio chagasii]CAH7219944.1 putative Type I site-specific deoxyribonuclease [Vibrio chagasii]
MSWPMVKLGEVAPSKPIKKIEVLNTESVWQLNLDMVESHSGKVISKLIAPLSEAGSSTHWFDERYVLYSKLRPYLNKVVLPDMQGLATTELVPMLPDPTRLDRRYLAHYLRSNRFVSWISDQVAGAKMPRVSMKVFWDHEIPLPPLDEQKRIAAILDKADAIRQKRKQAIALTDEFLRSVFLDMFGDPVTNPKGWEVKNLSDFYVDPKNGTKCGPFGSALKKEEFVETGIPVWNMDNISLKGVFFDSPKLWITPEKYEEISSYSVEQGDVIISRAGTVGKMGVVRSVHERSLISTNLIRVRFSEQLLPEYFVALMTNCRGRVGRLKTGPDGSFTHMNTGILDKLEFPYPPLPLQQKFVQILDDVNAYLEKQEDKKIETLFASLSQQAFSGQL